MIDIVLKLMIESLLIVIVGIGVLWFFIINPILKDLDRKNDDGEI